MAQGSIKRALVSVTDKTGVVEFVKTLEDEFGVEVISTGGTARVLADAGVNVVPIEQYTGFPEMMDGRVKTLHPKVHGGLLARRDDERHMAEAAEHGIQRHARFVALIPAAPSICSEVLYLFQEL